MKEKIEKFLPKNANFALLKIAFDTLYFLEESDNLAYLLNKQQEKELGASFYVIDKQYKFQHKLTLHQSLDLKSVSI